jgi:hypothetical protein
VWVDLSISLSVYISHFFLCLFSVLAVISSSCLRLFYFWFTAFTSTPPTPRNNQVTILSTVLSEAFAATGFNKIFSCNQPRQMYKRNRRFEDHVDPHHQVWDMIPEPTGQYCNEWRGELQAPWAPVYHIPDGEHRVGPRNVGFFCVSNVADCPRRCY